MILPNMNGIAIAKEMILDREQSNAFVIHKQRRFEKKRLNAFCYQGYEWHNRKTGNKYLITLSSDIQHIDKRTNFDFICEAESPRGKIWYRANDYGDASDGIVAFTVHFFKRYSERFCHIDEFPKVIHEFAARESFFSLIWQNEECNKGVFATKSGLILCSKRDDVIYCNTFISRDILKPSQLKAFDAIAENMKEYTLLIPVLHKRTDMSGMLKYKQIKDKFDKNTEYCHEIYNEYFEK